MPYKILGAFLTLLVLQACATLDEDACRGGDWFGIGLRDGADGRAPDFVQKHAKACADYGIAPDVPLWAEGRTEGLRTYCTIDNAYDEGRSGTRLKDVCQAYDIVALQRANTRGLNWFDITRDINQALSRIREIDSLLATLSDGDTTRSGLISERASLRLEILRLRSRRVRYL